MNDDPAIDRIREAFPAMPIVAARAFEQRGRLYCDTHEYRAALEGKTWEQLDPQVIARRSDALWFLGDEYLRAVLPMYLKLLLVFSPMAPMAGELLHFLTKPERTDRYVTCFDRAAARFEVLASGLSSGQTRVVALVLRRFIELYPNFHEPAERALDRYWDTTQVT